MSDASARGAAVDDAFPGAEVSVADRAGLFDIDMRQPGLLRPLGVAELSEGRCATCGSWRRCCGPAPAPLTVLNEPEASLHPDLIASLARLIGAAAGRAQVVVVRDAAALVEAPGALPGTRRFTLEKRLGETVMEGEAALGWAWPER